MGHDIFLKTSLPAFAWSVAGCQLVQQGHTLDLEANNDLYPLFLRPVKLYPKQGSLPLFLFKHILKPLHNKQNWGQTGQFQGILHLQQDHLKLSKSVGSNLPNAANTIPYVVVIPTIKLFCFYYNFAMVMNLDANI